MNRLAVIMRRRFLIALLAGVLAAVALPAVASAGQWVQVSCVNPDGSAAGSQGWSASTTSNAPSGSVSATCGPGAPMNEYLTAGTSTAALSYETLDYTPPEGSTLAGGTLNLSGYSGGNGTGAEVGAVVYTPQPLFPGNAVFECIEGFSTNACAPNDYTYSNSSVTIPANQGGDVQLQLACTGDTGQECDQGANANGYVGQLEMSSAQLLLSNASVPTASGFGGTILQPKAHGATHLVFTATDPSGPGVFTVSASIDGTQVYSGTPNTESGSCSSVGTDASSGALEFDSAQPCPQTVSVDVPINTSTLADGSHDLTVTVTDAAGNTSTVLDEYISTYNPITTTAPKAKKNLRQVRVRFTLSTRWKGTSTRLLKASTSTLSQHATLSVSDNGPHHPKLTITHATAAHAPRLLSALTRLTFHPGDHITLTVSVPGERTERLQLTIRDGRVPTAKLLQRPSG